MTANRTGARALLMGLVDIPEIIADTPDDADLIAAGLNSGDLVGLALAIEDQTGEALTDSELPLLHTVAGIAQVLDAKFRQQTGPG